MSVLWRRSVCVSGVGHVPWARRSRLAGQWECCGKVVDGAHVGSFLVVVAMVGERCEIESGTWTANTILSATTS